jgi:hypothetical protein
LKSRIVVQRSIVLYAGLIVVVIALGSPALAISRSESTSSGLLGQALICFYRELDWDSSEEYYPVRMRGENVGGLARGSFLYHFTPPGRRIVFVDADMPVSRSFKLRSGETYYIRIGHRSSGLLSGPKLLPVDAEKGVGDIRALSYSGPELSNIARQYCLRDDSS